MAKLAAPHAQASLMQADSELGFPFPEPDRMGTQGHVELLPNPDFVFPARPTDSSPTPPLQHWNALRGQPSPSSPPRPSSLKQRKRPSVSALPAFTFNPTSADANSSLNTPPQSPAPTTPTSPTTPSRAIGHRRGGSEFIGGDGKGGPGLMSTSPTKGEGVLPPPASRLGPPPGRRGHAHRRSGAISVHDMQSILQPKDANAQSRAGSAPTTPMVAEHGASFSSLGHARRATSETCLRGGVEQPFAAADAAPETSPQRRPMSARRAVGFADRVEYIRPLSTISSETESSMSTVRGHSVTGSLSSVISAGASSPPSARRHRASLTVTIEADSSSQRPRTAGDVLDSNFRSKEGLTSLNHIGNRPRSVQGLPKDEAASTGGNGSPRRSFGWWDHKNAPKQSTTPPVGSDLAARMSPTISPASSPGAAPALQEAEGCHQSVSARAETSGRKPRKVKSWASMIISRKPKSQRLAVEPLQRRPPTPPPMRDAEVSEEEDEVVTDFHFEPDFDVDNTVTIFSTPSPKRQRPSFTTETSPSKLRKTGLDDDAASPVIDLDAALGPFNTPPLGPDARSTAQRPPRARHSMRLNNPAHRRAESAPELVPFENKVKSSLMEDVFEEEDEDAYEGRKARSGTPDVRSAEACLEMEEDEIAGMGIHVVEDESTDGPKLISWPPQNLPSWANAAAQDAPISAEQLDRPAATPPPESQRRSMSPFAVPAREPTPVEVVEADEEPRASSLTKDSDSTVTPSITSDGCKESQALMSLSLPMPQHPVMTPDSLSGSSFSGRDFTTSSQASIDTSRLGTATSCGTESRSISFGEPGPELRMSYEDVPSLTSSRSTMTSPAQHPFARPASSFVPDDSRSMSFSLPYANERTRKRSSIASLSRLVGLSSGERSKLSIESRPQSQHSNVADGQERKRSKRLSKLVNFFARKQKELENS